MNPIVECVPNFSEGRRKEVMDAILAEITSVPGVTLLDHHADADHNRLVVTFVGQPEPVERAAFASIRRAAQLIDMDQHQGAHPRLGATDVVPFVPVAGVTMDECVAMARRLGARVGSELGIPVYFYEAAATRADRVNLENVRRGQYEGAENALKNPTARQRLRIQVGQLNLIPGDIKRIIRVGLPVEMRMVSGPFKAGRADVINPQDFVDLEPAPERVKFRRVEFPGRLSVSYGCLTKPVKKQEDISGLDALIMQMTLCGACLTENRSPFRVAGKALRIEIGIKMRKV